MPKPEPGKAMRLAFDNLLTMARNAATDPTFADHEEGCVCSVCGLLRAIQNYDEVAGKHKVTREQNGAESS